ncbi:7021_t:CDS:2 [Gigaspora margarita]|uniref:7021_t:CDS:1 n=1 Tax=Gigaspora margarita TaxID=4874 RepID=A0ABM8W779_GIGMA|nr:7021_t:CDS:2 [Gigaspora margarita]
MIFLRTPSINDFNSLDLTEQAAILVNNKIYFYGGISERTKFSDFFYLDVSTSFNITSMFWVNITPIIGLPVRTASTICIYGKYKDKIIYIGGTNIVGDNFTTVFDTTTQQWSPLKVSTNFTRRLIQWVVSENDVYVFGGDPNHPNQDHIIKLDTVTIAWTELNPGPVPIGGVQAYSAILLNNATILYIGGKRGSGVKTFSQTTSGDIPPSRYDHGAVFIRRWSTKWPSTDPYNQFNQILILYGNSSDEPIMALDTLTFEWSIPTIKNDGGPTIGLIRFTSILIGTYIFIAFGSFNDSGINSTNNFFLLDVSQKNNYEWVNSYDSTKQFQSVPTATTTHSATSNTSSYNNGASSNLYNSIGAIIGIAFGAIAGIIILSAAAVLIVRRYGHPVYYHAPQEGSSDKPNNEAALPNRTSSIEDIEPLLKDKQDSLSLECHLKWYIVDVSGYESLFQWSSVGHEVNIKSCETPMKSTSNYLEIYGIT